MPTRGQLRLVQGNYTTSTLTSGRLEIYLNGQWGTVCDDLWGQDESGVACQQLGYIDALGFGRSIDEGSVITVLNVCVTIWTQKLSYCHMLQLVMYYGLVWKRNTAKKKGQYFFCIIKYSGVPLPALHSKFSRTLVNIMGECFANEIVQWWGKRYEIEVTRMGMGQNYPLFLMVQAEIIMCGSSDLVACSTWLQVWCRQRAYLARRCDLLYWWIHSPLMLTRPHWRYWLYP